MTKYEPLQSFLQRNGRHHIPMTFEEIEQLIGDALPASARKHRAWWSNNPSNSVITYAWLNAGYKTTQVDLPGGKLVFARTGAGAAKPAAGGAPKPPRHPIFGALKGLVAVRGGADLTDPADPDWGNAP